MADYIDRDRLIKKFCNHCYFDVGEKNCAEDCYDMKIIKSLPTEDVQPVKHGCWKYETDYCLVCSECGNPAEINCITGDFMESPYCSECGARMDGKT